MEAPASAAAASGAAAAAARAAAAAKAVVATKPPQPAPAEAGPEETVCQAAAREAAAEEPREPPGAATSASSDRPGGGAPAPAPAALPLRGAASRPPQAPIQIFSIADDEHAPEVPSNSESWKETPLLEVNDEPPAPSVEPSLTAEEQQEYDEIEAQFQAFKARQSETERNVAALLERLNTRIHIPSSVASSECGDLTSLASSEWDTESLGPTEDGLSMLGSRMGSNAGTPRGGSPTNSPRELTPLQRAASSSSLGLQSQLLQAGIEWRAPPKATWSSAFAQGPGSSGAASSSQAPPPQLPERRGDGGLVLGPRGSDAGSEHGGAAAAGAADAAGAGATSADQPSLNGQTDRLGDADTFSPYRTPRLTQRLLQERASALSPQGPAWPGRFEAVRAAPSTPAGPAGGDSAPSSPPWSRPRPSSPQPSPASRLPQFGAPGVCDGSEVDQAAEEEEELRRWQGWTVVAMPEGRLFFYHETRQMSQWNQPPELNSILGEWVEMVDESQPSRPVFWRNEMLNFSLWKDPRQTTNLFQAALDGNIFFMQLYAEVDGQLDVADARGRGALHYSCAGGSTQSAVFLLQRGVQVDLRDDGAATPLIFACRYGYASVVKVLLDASADLNAAGGDGNAALHEAAQMGQLDCVHLLLLCGADPLRRNAAQETAGDLAASKRNYSCFTLLRRHESNQRPRPPGGPPGAAAAAGGAGLEARPAGASRGPARAAAATAEAKAGAWTSAQAGLPAATPPLRQRGADHAGVRRQDPSRPSRARYGGESESESDGNTPGASPLDPDGTDSGGATSESSEGAARGAAGPRGRSRRRERSPVALGLLSRGLQWIDSARRWVTGPVQADLGLPNKYQFNKETNCWELESEDAH